MDEKRTEKDRRKNLTEGKVVLLHTADRNKGLLNTGEMKKTGVIRTKDK